MFYRGCFLVGHHHDNFAAKSLLTKLERCLTVAVEIEIGIEFHDVPLQLVQELNYGLSVKAA